MEKPSSTSSSRRSSGPPWSLFTAIGLLLVLELALRLMNPLGLLAAPVDRELEYRGVIPELEAYGAPEVAIVGSSRARRAVLSPLLHQYLGAKGLKVRVGSFALGGAMAEEVEAAVRRLLEASPRPRLIVWAISPREFEVRRFHPTPQVRYLWRPRDWWLARRNVGSKADTFLPDAIRNEGARHSLVVRYRFAMRDLVERPPRRRLGQKLADLFLGRRGPTPLHGDVDAKHAGKLRIDEVDPARVEARMSRSYLDRSWPQNYQADHLDDAVRDVRQARVALLFVELPTHTVLESLLPENTKEKFRTHLRGVATRHSVSFVSVDDLRVEFTNNDFGDSSHLNRRGAEKYTTAIRAIVARELRASR